MYHAMMVPELQRERERERESFIRNNLHNGVVSGAARGQALLELLGPMWAGLTIAHAVSGRVRSRGGKDKTRDRSFHSTARSVGVRLVFGGCAFPPVSLGPAGDCPCRD